MKLEITKEGKVLWTIESTDGSLSQNDIVTVISNCSISPTGFDELFFQFVREEKTHVAAYERAERVHEIMLGKRKYSDYESFSEAKRKRLKK
jgi:hypothetical protein